MSTHNDRHGKTGLVDKIRAAESPREIDKLLHAGESYAGASARTKRRWLRAAEARTKWLSKEIERKTLVKK